MRVVTMLVLMVALAGGGALVGPAAAAETLLRLSETARVMTSPDQIVASLRAEATAPASAEAQARVNAAIARALAQAKQVNSVTATTGNYSVWNTTIGDRAKAREEWRASQTLDLKGGDGAAMLRLVGELQAQGLAVGRLAWQLAPDTARKARTEATRLALGSVRARAEEAAGILGLRFESFREVRLDDVKPPPAPMMRSMAASTMAAAPPPSAEAEDVAVEASVEADAVLVPR
jgi:predicted secreted protein